METPDVHALRQYLTPQERDELNRIELHQLQDSLTLNERHEAKKILEGAPDLESYIKDAWHVLEPGTPFVDNWHIGAIAEHLEAVTSGEIKSLIINIPPGHMKSLECCVFWPTWMWIFEPHARFLFSSHAQPLSTRDAVKSRTLITSNWYQERWGHKFKLTGDQNEKTRYANDRTGVRVSTSVGRGTGERGNYLCWDDPHNIEQVHSDSIRQSVLEWWRTTWSQRKADARTSREVGIMQRLHEKDLTGFCLSEIGGYEHLCLPARFEQSRCCVTSLGWKDPRTEEGELIWPEKNGEAEVEKSFHDLGSYSAAGQMQQRPSPAGGGILKAQHWRFWYPLGVAIPAPVQAKTEDGSFIECLQERIPVRFERQLQSWDCAFKDTKAASFVVGQAWGKYLVNAYLLDQIREKLNLPKTCEAVVNLSKRFPNASAKYIEDKANGPAVMQTLQGKIPGLIAIEPMGDKIARAVAITPFQEGGNVYLPHPHFFPWVQALIDECTMFPNGEYNDQVDALSQALMKMFGGQPGSLARIETGAKEKMKTEDPKLIRSNGFRSKNGNGTANMRRFQV